LCPTTGVHKTVVAASDTEAATTVLGNDNDNNNNNNNNNLQLVCQPVAVVILHIYKI